LAPLSSLGLCPSLFTALLFFITIIFLCRTILHFIGSTMATPTIDTNQWYQLYTNEDKTSSLIGTSLFNRGGTTGAVFFNTTDTSTNVQRWQIFPVTVNGSTAYTIRSKDGGPNGFMGTGFNANGDTATSTRPMMLRGDIANNTVFWSFNSWGDGTWFLTNAANNDQHLNRQGNGLLSMSSNITAPQNGQRWGLASIAKIDDEKYSSVNVRLQSCVFVQSNTDTLTVGCCIHYVG
jgi:hypothetical protein